MMFQDSNIETPKKDYRNRRDECLDVSDDNEVLCPDYQKELDNDPAYQEFISKHNRVVF